MNDALLHELERDPRGAEILELSWEELDLDLVPIREIDHLLDRLERVETIREALQLRLSRRDAENLAACVRDLLEDYVSVDGLDAGQGHGHEPPEAPPVGRGGLSPGMDRDALGRWAVDHEVADLLGSDIGAIVAREVLFRTNTWRTDQRVRDVICAPPRSHGRWSDPSPELQELSLIHI